MSSSSNGTKLWKGYFIFYPFDHVHLAIIESCSLDKPGSGWHYPSETNSPRKSGGAFEKESYSYTRIKFKATISSNRLFWVFGAKCNKVTGNLHSEVSELNIHSDTSRRTTNCIVVECSPLLPTQKDQSPILTLCHANVRAVKSKTVCLREYISSTAMDIFGQTETWLTEKDIAAKLEIYFPESHSFIQQDQNGRRGGGTELLFKKAIDVKKIAAGEKSSIEFSEWRVSFNSLRAKLIVVYRAPYFEAHPITPWCFLRRLALISRQLFYLRSLLFQLETIISMWMSKTTLM